MLVADVMSTGLLTAAPDDSVRSVVEKMVSRHCGAIPVVDNDKQTLIGIIAIRDIILPLYPNFGDYIHDEIHTSYFAEMEEMFPQVLEKSARDIMTSNPHVLQSQEPLLKAASIMGVKNLRRMPVVNGERLVGMLSIGDVTRALFMEYVNKAVPLQAAR